MRILARSAVFLLVVWFAGCREAVGPGGNGVVVISQPKDTTTGVPNSPTQPIDTGSVVIIIRRR